MWGSDLYGWEELGGTEEGTKDPWEGVSRLPQGWTRPWALRCKSAILDLVKLGESHSQPSAAVTVATRGCLRIRPLCWARKAATEQC